MNTSLLDKQKKVAKDLSETFVSVEKSLGYEDSLLQNAMRYSMLSGGKRMRPLLLTLVAEMLNANANDIKYSALALECIHTYSLVHDDLPAMDNDELRRGKPTCHIEFDEANAILAGDALQTMAFECLSAMPFESADPIKLVKILSKASGARGMCLGQSIDLLSTDKAISIEELSKLHNLKTGALLQAAVLMGTELGRQDLSQEVLKQLSVFAADIGLAFQIQDDILDVTADTQTLGKPQGSDQASNKSTFVTHYGLEGAQKELQKLHQSAIQTLQVLKYNTEALEEFTNYMITRTY